MQEREQNDSKGLSSLEKQKTGSCKEPSSLIPSRDMHIKKEITLFIFVLIYSFL